MTCLTLSLELRRRGLRLKVGVTSGLELQTILTHSGTVYWSFPGESLEGAITKSLNGGSLSFQPHGAWGSSVPLRGHETKAAFLLHEVLHVHKFREGHTPRVR